MGHARNTKYADKYVQIYLAYISHIAFLEKIYFPYIMARKVLLLCADINCKSGKYVKQLFITGQKGQICKGVE